MNLKPSQIVKLLQSVAQPVYLLDARRRIVFCNHALEHWTGCEASQLLGQTLRYHAPPSRLRHELVAAALCPPPEVFDGLRGTALLTVDQIKRTSCRRAEFLPLPLSADARGILVLVDGEDIPDGPEQAGLAELAGSGSAFFGCPENPEERSRERLEAADLHRTLLEWRTRHAQTVAIDRFPGNAPLIQRLRRQIEWAVRSPVPVLILGEPGCGKEHLARSIHFDRGKNIQNGPGGFVPVDCRLLTPDLIASTLIAFRKRYLNENAAKRARPEARPPESLPEPGRERPIHTLLLNDADLFPAEHLPLLAEWIASAPLDQRILATSPLTAEKWKDDYPELFALLGTFVLEIPPLRERREEIPLFAQRFLESRNARAEKQLTGFSAEALDLLTAYRWPGNLAELEVLIGEAWEATPSGLVPLAHLPERLHHVADALKQPIPSEEILPLEPFLLEMERELLERALRKARGNKSKAAQLLGLTRPKLYRRLEVHGMGDGE